MYLDLIWLDICNGRQKKQRKNMWSLLIYSCATHRTEPLLQVRGVDQVPSASCFLQHRKHDLNPQRWVQMYNVVDVVEEPRGLHLEQETVVLKI